MGNVRYYPNSYNNVSVSMSNKHRTDSHKMYVPIHIPFASSSSNAKQLPIDSGRDLSLLLETFNRESCSLKKKTISLRHLLNLQLCGFIYKLFNES